MELSCGECSKSWNKVNRLAGNRVSWKCFTNAYVPNGMKEYTTTTTTTTK